MNNDKERTSFLLRQFNSSTPKRYTTKALPSYRHIPGTTPHPVADINGHSFNRSKEITVRVSENNWKSNEFYLYAIDLFNSRFFWEAHEALEDLWRLEPNSILKNFLQGLIQLSAAYLKWLQGISEGQKKLSFKAFEKLLKVKDSKTTFCGIDLLMFIDKNREFLDISIVKNSLPPVIDLIEN